MSKYYSVRPGFFGGVKVTERQDNGYGACCICFVICFMIYGVGRTIEDCGGGHHSAPTPTVTAPALDPVVVPAVTASAKKPAAPVKKKP